MKDFISGVSKSQERFKKLNHKLRRRFNSMDKKMTKTIQQAKNQYWDFELRKEWDEPPDDSEGKLFMHHQYKKQIIKSLTDSVSHKSELVHKKLLSMKLAQRSQKVAEFVEQNC